MNTHIRQIAYQLEKVLLVLFLPVMISCEGKPQYQASSSAHMNTISDSTEKQRVIGSDGNPWLKERAEKDESFRTEASPLPASIRADFHGLSYYPPTSAMVFTVPLVTFPHPEVVTIGATKGDVRKMLRYGTLTFQLDGKSYSLTAYKSPEDPNLLFIPFKDATNGKETYQVGRYLDIAEHPGDAPYVLDFNRAYNPYCAYSDNFTCPLVPGDNVLPVAIQAGEKLPSWGAH